MIQVYTDGSIHPNPGGPMGWGFIAIDTETGEILMEHSDGREATIGNSNNKAELAALICALRWLRGRPAEIYSDSEYVVKGTNEWSPRWAIKGFRRMKFGVVEHAQRGGDRVVELVDDPASSADGLLGREHGVGGSQRGVVLGGHAGSPPPVAGGGVLLGGGRTSRSRSSAARACSRWSRAS